MGSKGTVQLPQQQTQTNNVAPNPVALAAYSDLIGRAQGVGSTPYQPYGGQLVQGFSPQQQQAFGEVGGLQGAAQPYIDKGAGLAMAGATAADPTHFGANVGAYESPYTDQVVNATMANINETNAQQQNSVVGDAIAKGAMGGDRVGVAQAELARQQNLSNNQTIAGLRNTGFQNATAELNQGAAAQGQGAYSMGALGNEAQSTGLQGANALLQTGGLQQQLGQANLSTAYQQFLNQQAYPFQNLSWLSGIINGTGPNMGQSSTGMSQGYTSQLAPNPLNSIAGLGIAGLGLFSDERVKEDVREVGRLNDGQKLYRYRYKGHPDYHVGLIAQEVEKRHPDAVGSVDGIKTVDYREATDDAVRAHKAGGGGLSGIPYADFASGGLGGIVGYVPAPAQISARGLQLPAMPQLQQPGTNSGQAGQDIKLPGADALSKAKTGLGNIGSSIGDYLSADTHDYASDLAGGLSALARGGGVRGYDDGGTVSDLTYNPDTDAVSPSDLVLRPGDRGDIIPAGLGGTEGRSVDDPYASRRYGQESGGRQFDTSGNPIISPKGAVGLAQVMPSTGPEAAALAGLPWDENRLYTDPDYNKKLGDAYYAKQYTDFGDHDKAHAAYNAGPGRLRQALSSAAANGGDWKDYLPAETQNYVASITGSQDGGLGAISDATNSSGNGLGSVTEGRSADDGTTTETAKGLFDKANVLGLPDNARTALIAAGLGMAASKSHWLGPALGEGGLEGVKAYQTQQKTGIEQQRANQLGEYQKGHLGIEQSKVNLQLQQLQRMLDAAREASGVSVGSAAPATSGAPTNLAPQRATSPMPATPAVPTIPQGAQQPSSASAPASSGTSERGSPAPQQAVATVPGKAGEPPASSTEDEAFLQKVEPSNNPRTLLAESDRLRNQADVYRRQAQVYRARGFANEGNQLDGKADSTLLSANNVAARADSLAKGPLLMRDGSTQTMPSMLKAQATAKTNETAAVESGKRGTQMFELNKKPYEEAAAAKDLAIQTKANAQAMKHLVFDENGKPVVSTGPQGDYRQKLASNMEQLGWFKPETIQRVTGTDPANAEAIKKLSTDMVGEIARQSLGPGNRLYATEYKNYMQGVPSNEILPRTIAFLTDRIITPKSDWTINRFAHIAENDLHGSNLQSDLFRYDKAHPLDEILSPKSNAIPAAADRVVDKTYTTPRGPLVWKGNGWVQP